MNELIKLEYPCPLCGGELFSTQHCKGGIGQFLEETEKCVVVGKHLERKQIECSIFCFFKCRGEKIDMYNSEVSCKVINKRVSREFKHFSSIPLDKGFKI